jgi:uncharacterized protein with PIN domain
MATVRFAVDRMLGRLARWLRLIGQDAAYGPTGGPLVRLARSEGRTILTRDRTLLRHPNVQLIFISSDHFRQQLQQVIHTFHLDPYSGLFTRCTWCNRLVMPLTRDAAAAEVPPYVAATQRRFGRCPECGRVYWFGTHAELVQRELRGMGYPSDRPHGP